MVAAVGRRVEALRASGVDVTVISRDGSVPAELPAGCRVARGDAGAEVMRGILAVLARRGVGPGLLLAHFGDRGFTISPEKAHQDVQGGSAPPAAPQGRRSTQASV